ncbi:MAG: DUF5698 domain-containing protein [Patescibacteria group bacterium]
MALLTFFAIGVVEMFIVALWTKFVSGSQVVASGVVTFVNTLVYFYVLDALLSNVHNTPVIVAYAVGCALGTMIATPSTFTMSFKKRKNVKRKKTQREQFTPIHEPELVV